MEEILQWAIAGYMSNPEADDDEVEGLVAGGFPRGLASRAVVFLPLAFGRRILRGLVKLPDTFVTDGRERPLASEPMFAIAEKLAADAGRESIGRIGPGSAEVRVVNKVLNAGLKLDDAMLSPPHLWFNGPTDGAVSIASMLAAFMSGHGSTLACEARVYPRALTAKVVNGQLDILVSARALGARQINESFAYFGSTIADARGAAMKTFAQGSLHVLLAALDDPEHGHDQVEWETWGDFRVCMGSLLRQWSDETPVDFSPFVDEIKARLLAAKLSREVHWYRTFVAVGKDGVIGHDALLDNDPWPPGVEAMTGWPWPRAETPYALRHFLVLIPNAG